MLNEQLRATLIKEEEYNIQNQEIMKILLDIARTMDDNKSHFEVQMMMLIEILVIIP